jgi:iron complex outermembrane receptor protein
MVHFNQNKRKMANRNQYLSISLGLALAGLPCLGHTQGGGKGVTEEIIIEATRVEKAVTEIPAGVSVVGQDDIQLARQQLGLNEALVRVPGLFSQNGYNFAQDLRVAIRGFGARGNFGIRGVKIIIDGIPGTLPDGQGQVDSIDIGSAGEINVIRGAVSSLYGNASGGVISINTEDTPDDPYVDGRVAFGDYDYRKYQLKAGGRAELLDYLLSGSYLELDGYRDHSRVENKNFNSRFRFNPDDSSELAFIVNAFDSPIAQDPGGLTAAEVAQDRSQARNRNVQFDAGEALDQQKLGATYRKDFGSAHRLIARGYGLWRDFENKLPFVDGGAVAFDRTFFGGGVQYINNGSVAAMPNRLTVGVDLDKQDDDRLRFDNNNGVIGALTFDQSEEVRSVGVFVQDELSLSDQVELTLGARYDEIEFDVTDRFLGDGDDSGSRKFDEVSPMVGLLWRATELLNIYGNVSTAFETPTTTELASPTGGGGFNANLEPQTATNYELGLKGRTASGVVAYELALFHIETKDELIPFELAQFPGRTFFENAGETTRDGIEAGLVVIPAPGWRASASYTYSDFVFENFISDGDSFDGNRLPGLPRQLFFADLGYEHGSGLYAIGDLLYAGKLFADNANDAEVDSYTVANLRAGWRKRFGAWEVHPFFGVNNVFDEEYNDNIRINAFGGRYFEPAPERNFFAGLTVRKDFSG